MDNLETKPSAQPDLSLSELQAQYEELRHLVVSAMVLLLIVSGALNLYLLRQWRFTKTDLDAVRPQATQLITDYNRSAVAVQDFIKKLADFGRSHPDFAPIAAKYHLIEMTSKPGSAPPASAVPSTTTAPMPASAPAAVAPAAVPPAKK
jgi:cytoskeletal protein RodZ